MIAFWPFFVKAGRPDRGALIYNTYRLVKIAGHHGALSILFLIPVVNIVIRISVALGGGRAIERGAAFSLVLPWLLSIVGYPVLE